MRKTHGSMAIALSFVIFSASSKAEDISQVILSDGINESILAACDPFYGCERPRLNDLGEVVWTERLSIGVDQYGIYSNLRGLIDSGFVNRGPDINNLGEVVWRFGDGGAGANGIKSSVRGVIYQGSGQDPYYNTQRINNLGEIIASIGDGGRQIWSNIRGPLPTVGTFARETSVNDSGEVVYTATTIGTPMTHTSIQSTVRGEIVTDAASLVSRPVINNPGEIVWVHTGTSGFEVWSNLRGKIADGEDPSINDVGEIVWSGWDGHDYELFSSLRGQITFNDFNDIGPQINNLGEIAWLRTVPGIAPEPGSAFLSAVGWLALVALFDRRQHSANARRLGR